MCNEYLKISEVPIGDRMLAPVLKKCQHILDSNNEYLDVRIYINKYVFDHFEMNDEKIDVFSFDKSKVYDIEKNYNIRQNEVIDNLKKLYDSDLVTRITDELIEVSMNECANHESYEDYDFDECLHISCKKMLNKYCDRVETIYILISFEYPEYISIYYDIYKKICKNNI